MLCDGVTGAVRSQAKKGGRWPPFCIAVILAAASSDQRPVSPPCKGWQVRIGARGRNRTGTPCGEGFSSRFGFRRQRGRCSWAGARLHHSLAAVGARRLLSTPSQPCGWAWLGVGSDAMHPGRSPNLTGVTSGVSPRRLKLFKSLVSTDFTTRARALPVPGREHTRQGCCSARQARYCGGSASRMQAATETEGEGARRHPQARLKRKVTTLLRLVTMSCAPLHLENSEPLQYGLRDIPL
ncbi:hypothetical protein CBM2588_A130015 [Cupriavidus taiwanensis]|nr:hypothetical protein CBM2588_A130015 [Cupriavidus taiwanensis]SOZ54824.1 hypothetical protein CBM2617_A180015 [Cupriavidus taiwanensis]SOZ78362.1 hypothetical protein CBM2618_A170015 [Cupriavidus taiwanensis]SOZ85476.1 hypothetical protein CBM2621_A160015 [Cupriavidus taiwanensis]SPA44672.1 hypothetical protein CBM2629_A160015 [Cupriavidus taiwanensis]